MEKKYTNLKITRRPNISVSRFPDQIHVQVSSCSNFLESTTKNMQVSKSQFQASCFQAKDLSIQVSSKSSLSLFFQKSSEQTLCFQFSK